VSAGKGQREQPGPEGFTWRGIDFAPPAPAAGPAGFYTSAPIEVAPDRIAEWKVHRPKGTWHARLRIGGERYPGVGATAAAALDDAAAEARNVATYIVAMLPEARELRGRKAPPRRRAIKVRLADGCSRRR
jgi:hypothetical protein